MAGHSDSKNRVSRIVHGTGDAVKEGTTCPKKSELIDAILAGKEIKFPPKPRKRAPSERLLKFLDHFDLD